MRLIRGPDLRCGAPTLVGVMPAGRLVDLARIPVYEHNKDSGYQRNHSESRVRDLAKEIAEHHVDLPTAVLLSLRDVKSEDVLAPLGDDEYDINLAHDHKFQVVDGQHRILALKRAIEVHGAKVQNLKVPVVCMIGASEVEELEQFYVVNSNAKSVAVSLSGELVAILSDHSPSFRDRLVDKGKDWQVEARDIVKHLSKNSNIWQGRIRFANAQPELTTVTSAGLIKSLRPVLGSMLFRTLFATEEAKAKAVHTYWVAVSRVLPDAFREPKQWNVQRNAGVEVIHGIYPVVLDCVRAGNQGSQSPKAEQFVPVLEELLPRLRAYNGYDQEVTGEEFWKYGKSGGFGNFTNGRGKAMLIKRLASMLGNLGSVPSSDQERQGD